MASWNVWEVKFLKHSKREEMAQDEMNKVHLGRFDGALQALVRCLHIILEAMDSY